MSLANLGSALAGLPTNPLFDMGVGMLATPYQRTPVSFGQSLANGMGFMQSMQAQQQRAQAQRAAARLAQQRGVDAHTQALAATALDNARLNALQHPEPKFDAAQGVMQAPDGTLTPATVQTPNGPVPLAQYTAAHTPTMTGVRLPPGYMWNAGRTAAEPIPGVRLRGDAPANGAATAAPGAATSFAQLDPETQALVRKVASYEVMPQNLSNYVRKGQGLTRQQILGYAAVLNPQYNVNNADAANAYLKDMAKSSPTSIGGQAQSLNMLLHHLGPMMQANADLRGTGNQWVNRAQNAFNTTFRGDSPAGVAPGNWEQGKTFVTQELGKLLKGGVASEGEVKELESGLNAAKSPAQRAQGLYNLADYVYGKIQAMTDRRDRLLGGMAPKSSLLDAQSEKNLIDAYKLEHLAPPTLLPAGTNYATGADDVAAPAAAAGAHAAPAIGAIEDGYRFKGGNPADQSNWEKVQ